jgi:hypothetical protein
MGVKLFVFSLFIVSILSLFSEITQKVSHDAVQETPLVTFTDATMYTLNEGEVLRIVEAQNAVRYKTRDEMYDGTIITRVKDNANNSDVKDIIRADKMVKKENLYSFFDNVKYDRENLFSLRTHELYYDVQNEIAYNYQPFNSIYKGDVLNGTNLYLDNKINFLKAQKSHFEINMNAQNKTN